MHVFTLKPICCAWVSDVNQHPVLDRLFARVTENDILVFVHVVFSLLEY